MASENMGQFLLNGQSSKQASTEKQLIEKRPLREGMDIPFGPPPVEYKYRRPHCGCEMWVNEAIIDLELGFAEFKGREAVMPLVGWPDCNRETLAYTGAKSVRRAII